MLPTIADHPPLTYYPINDRTPDSEHPMTAQASDVVLYLKKEFSLAGISGDGLFDPTTLGLQPIMMSTGCWRGFICKYAVQDDHLLLTTLTMQLPEATPAPRLFGRTPLSRGHGGFFYSRLNHPIPFTGGLLLGRNFIERLYVHMGFHPAWKFKQVHELIFEDGQLRQSIDRSQAAEDFRKKIKSEDLKPSDRRQILAWIEQTFSLRYERG